MARHAAALIAARHRWRSTRSRTSLAADPPGRRGHWRGLGAGRNESRWQVAEAPLVLPNLERDVPFVEGFTATGPTRHNDGRGRPGHATPSDRTHRSISSAGVLLAGIVSIAQRDRGLLVRKPRKRTPRVVRSNTNRRHNDMKHRRVPPTCDDRDGREEACGEDGPTSALAVPNPGPHSPLLLTEFAAALARFFDAHHDLQKDAALCRHKNFVR